MDILQQMQDMAEELVAMRRHLHQYPEASMQEFETSAYVKKQLDAMGVEWVAAGPTGVVGIVKGSQPGPVVGLRGDMDALEMDEQNVAMMPTQRRCWGRQNGSSSTATVCAAR